MDIYEMDRQRILGITRGAEVAQRVQQDAQLRAAIAIEQEQRAAAMQAAEARAAEAQMIAQAETAAVGKLHELIPLYAERQDVARKVLEAVSELWRLESQLRAGLNEANYPLLQVEALIEPSQRADWRSALRDRAGLPSRHIYAPDVQPSGDGQAVGVTVIRAITANVIQPGTIAAGRDIVNL